MSSAGAITRPLADGTMEVLSHEVDRFKPLLWLVGTCGFLAVAGLLLVLLLTSSPGRPVPAGRSATSQGYEYGVDASVTAVANGRATGYERAQSTCHLGAFRAAAAQPSTVLKKQTGAEFFAGCMEVYFNNPLAEPMTTPPGRLRITRTSGGIINPR
jgi:hypothetical protein